MNDFEHQLSRQPLREPPPEWRAGILSGDAKIVEPSCTWQSWFWPSPVAWGALAAVWVGVFLFNGSGSAAPALLAADHAPASSPSTPLYAFASHRDLSALLDPSN